MTLASDPHLDPDFALSLALRAYVDAVSRALGLGWESCSVDADQPLAGYIALDRRLRAHPGCDVALLWHEHRGWSAVLETPSGEDLTLARLPQEILPAPTVVATFARDLFAGHIPPARRAAAPLTTAELTAGLAPYLAMPFR